MAAVLERDTSLEELKAAARHTAVYGLGNVLAKAVGFLMLPFYTHYLAPADYGILEILDLSMSLFGMFLTMGMTASVLRSYAAAEGREKKRVISTAFTFVAATALVTYGFGMAIIQPVSAALFGATTPTRYLVLSFSAFIISYVAILPRTYLRALQASGMLTLIDTAGLIAMLALNIYFIASLRMGVSGVLLSSLLVGAAQMSWMSVWTLWRVGVRFSIPSMQEMFRFGWPLMFSNLAVFVLNFSDRFFLQHFRSLDVVGVYAVGYKFAFMMNFLIVQPFYVMWQSRMYMVREHSNHADIFRRIFVLYALVLVFAALMLSMGGTVAIQFMIGEKFAASQKVVPVVTAAYAAWGLAFYFQVGLYVTGNTRKIGLISAAAAIVNLALNVVLIRAYGMMGAAWATCISFTVMAAGSYLWSQRVFPLALDLPRIGGAIGIAAGLYAASHFVGGASFAGSVASKGVLLLAFPVLLWKLPILSAADRAVLVTARHSVLARITRQHSTAAERAANA